MHEQQREAMKYLQEQSKKAKLLPERFVYTEIPADKLKLMLEPIRRFRTHLINYYIYFTIYINRTERQAIISSLIKDRIAYSLIQLYMALFIRETIFCIRFNNVSFYCSRRSRRVSFRHRILDAICDLLYLSRIVTATFRSQCTTVA